MEKVLFICRANVGRSQVAMEYYNRLHPLSAESAGTIVDQPGQKVSDWEGSEVVIEAMREIGIDISGNRRRQVSEDMLKRFGRVIVMAEPESIPDYLDGLPNYEYWNVTDLKDKNLVEARTIIGHIWERVEDLVARSTTVGTYR